MMRCNRGQVVSVRLSLVQGCLSEVVPTVSARDPSVHSRKLSSASLLQRMSTRVAAQFVLHVAECPAFGGGLNHHDQ